MIADKITNLKLYGDIVPAEEILAFVEKVEKEKLPTGRYELDGDNLFALVQEYESKPKAEARMESHRLYTDLQYVISGLVIEGVALYVHIAVRVNALGTTFAAFTCPPA